MKYKIVITPGFTALDDSSLNTDKDKLRRASYSAQKLLRTIEWIKQEKNTF